MARRNTRLLAEEKDRAERRVRRGPAGEPGQDRVPVAHVARDTHAHERHHGHDGPIALEASATTARCARAWRKVTRCPRAPAVAHQRHPRHEQDRRRQGGDKERAVRPVHVHRVAGGRGSHQASERNVAFDTVWWRARCPAMWWAIRCGSTRWSTTSLGNAFKFTPEGGSVTLRIERLADAEDGCIWLRFAVDDTGCGIEPEHLDKIFASFEQGDASVARKHGGTGLGLAITKRFVELMGGRIRVASVVGHGSSFAVDVPLGRATERRPSSNQPEEPSHRARRPPSGRARLRGRAHPRGRGQRPEPGDSRGAYDHGGRERRDGLHGPRRRSGERSRPPWAISTSCSWTCRCPSWTATARRAPSGPWTARTPPPWPFWP